jgi:hypothetical protein
MSENTGVPTPEATIEASETGEASTPTASLAEMTGAAKPEASKEPSKEAKVEQAKAESKKKFKLKVDGKEEDFELDLGNEEELKKHLQLSKASQKRMQEMSDLRKQVEEFVEFAKKNPRGLLKELGLDDRKFAEEIINEALEESKKTPEQIEREKLQKELESLKAERDKEKSERERAEFERIKSEQAQKLDDEMTSALDTGGLPKSPYTIKRMADYMLLAARNNVDLNPADIVHLIKKEMQSDLKDFFSASPDELVEELVTSDRITNIRKKALAKSREQASVQNATQVKPTGNTEAKSESSKKDAKKQTVRDWLYNS